ncbi:MAG: 50S ribosomal protein L19 [Chloroflexi bacterium]|nr:50S ribosomal protein L19 [Chloroflexota bacterium]
MATLIEVPQKSDIPAISPGDTVKVHTKVIEGDKERTQLFQGVALKIKHGGAGPILTVRRITYGVGVERTFPLNSPRVEKVDVVRRGKTRRARLYYLRGLSARASRIKEKREEKKPEEQPKVEQKAE